MLDEYVDDAGRAFAALDQAQVKLGPMPSLIRARAKIHLRSRDHKSALLSLEEVWADAQSSHDEVERGFIAREAGISAAETGDWAAARMWFERARVCFSAFDTGSLPSLKIGLGADAAQASFKAGDVEGAIAGYTRALDELKHLDPDGSLHAAYCHRVVRNAVLWLMRETSGAPVDFEETVQPPGACSNPDPLESIRDHPLGPLDLAWYLLADAALDLGQARFFHDLHRRLGSGPILGLEVSRQNKLANYLLSSRDVAGLVAALPNYASAFAYLKAEGLERGIGDLVSPVRAALPAYRLDGSEPPAAQQGAIDLLISFAAARAMEGDGEAVRQIRLALSGDEWSSVRRLAKLMAGAEGHSDDFAEYTAVSIAEVAAAGGSPGDATAALTATIRLLLWVSRSEFKAQMSARLEAWAIKVWSEFVERQRFRLRNPSQTAPIIAAAIAQECTPLSRVARIALAADAAVPLIISGNVRGAEVELAAS